LIDAVQALKARQILDVGLHSNQHFVFNVTNPKDVIADRLFDRPLQVARRKDFRFEFLLQERFVLTSSTQRDCIQNHFPFTRSTEAHLGKWKYPIVGSREERIDARKVIQYQLFCPLLSPQQVDFQSLLSLRNPFLPTRKWRFYRNHRNNFPRGVDDALAPEIT